MPRPRALANNPSNCQARACDLFLIYVVKSTFGAPSARLKARRETQTDLLEPIETCHAGENPTTPAPLPALVGMEPPERRRATQPTGLCLTAALSAFPSFPSIQHSNNFSQKRKTTTQTEKRTNTHHESTPQPAYPLAEPHRRHPEQPHRSLPTSVWATTCSAT
jgi:hypothetical protein